MADKGHVQIRSYRNCFKLERRIHKIDRWQIPLPFGIPLRGLGYSAAIAAAMFVLGRLPVAGLVLGAVAPEIRFVVVPIGLSYALTRWEIDGRPAHTVLRSLVLLRLQPARIAGWRAAERLGPVSLGRVTIAPDDRAARLQCGVVRGPARVLIRYPFRGRSRGRSLRIAQLPGPPQWRGREVSIKPGQRLVIR